MALLKALCWALMFIIGIRFPPGTSLATVNEQNLVSQKSSLFPRKVSVVILSLLHGTQNFCQSLAFS